MFIHGIAASENIDSSGERISIAGMDISSLEVDGVFNYEHKSDQPSHVIGKILKARKIFSEQDCEDDYQLAFFQKCGVPYLYVMGELLDGYKASADEVAGMFRYDLDKKDQNKRNIMNFSIEGAKIEKVGMDIAKSIARKVTITVLPCNKAAIAEIVPVEKKKTNNIDELFKTEVVEIEVLEKTDGLGMAMDGGAPTSPSLAASELKKDQPKLTLAPNVGTKIGATGGINIMSHAKPGHYGNLSSQQFRSISSSHFDAARSAQKAGNSKLGQHHMNQVGWFNQAAERSEFREKQAPKPTTAITPNAGQRPKTLFDPAMSGKMTPPGHMKKALDAGSGMAAPSQLSGGAALASESLEKKKSKWLARAEDEYVRWDKKEQFESFMAKRMPHLTKGEVRAIGQVMMLNKSMNMEKALSSFANLQSMQGTNIVSDLMKGQGKDSIYTLILFEGCDLHHILHCSHFATDDMTGTTLEKIKKVCDDYFEKGAEPKELSFNDAGTLGKEDQPVLFLSEGDPYRDLFDKLKEVADYKYPAFKPHVSVTSNVDSFKGKTASLVISVNGEIKQRYDFQHKDNIPGGLADNKKIGDFDPKNLAEGIKIELEHTSDPKIAEEIAMDHLSEDPNYYKKLKKIEKK